MRCRITHLKHLHVMSPSSTARFNDNKNDLIAIDAYSLDVLPSIANLVNPILVNNTIMLCLTLSGQLSACDGDRFQTVNIMF